MTPPDAPVHGYALVLPPGWLRIPVEGSGPVVRDLLDRTFAGLPADSYGPHRRELKNVLDEQIAAAREIGGLDVYLPVEGARGLPVAASFVVSHLPPASQAPQEVLVALAADGPDSDAVSIDGAAGLRTRRAVASDPLRQSGLDTDTERVTYVLAVPGDAGWLLVSFSTAITEAAVRVGPHDVRTLSETMIELFDAVVSTLRWRTG